jgi:hypothetical protein
MTEAVITKVAAPALPAPERVYDPINQGDYTNILRLFFRRLTNILGILVDRNSVAFHSDVSGEIDALTDKPIPANADIFMIEDSADSWSKKKITFDSLVPADVYVTSDEVIGPFSGTDLGERVFICTNTAAITLTLPDLTTAEVTVIRQNGPVTIDTPDAATINGELTQQMPSRYDAAHLKGTTTGWIAI